MARNLYAFALLLLAVATLLHSSAAQVGTPPTTSPEAAPSSPAVNYTVGDTTGWTVPSSASAYETWASGKTFKVGDILVFNFAASAHDVAEVTKENYDSCNTTSPLALFSIPPVNVTLNKSGENYFLCAIPGHCNRGQKLAINVSASSTSSPSPPGAVSPPTSGAVSPPPENSHASSLGAVAGFSATLLSIAAALFY